MTKLQECLYQYISEERFSVVKADAEFIAAQRMRDQAEKKLSDGLTAEQRRLFSRYMDEENRLAGIHLRHIFRETLVMMQDILMDPLNKSPYAS